MNVNEIKNGQIVRLKFGDRFENAKVLGLMGEYVTVSVKSLGKQITTKTEDVVPYENNCPKKIEYTDHCGKEIEDYIKKNNIKKVDFFVKVAGIPSGSYTNILKQERVSKENWDKFEKAKKFIESLDKEDLIMYQKKPKICTVPGFKIGKEENKKDPDNERIELIEKLQNDSKINEFRQNEEVMEEIKMEDMKPKSWIESYKELIRSLSMEETFEFFNQVKIDAKRFEEMFDEVKRSII